MATEPAKLRVMIDATVLVAGSGWPRWPREVLLAGLRNEIQLVVSQYVIDQARRALTNRLPQHLGRFEEFISQGLFEVVPDPSAEEVARHKGLVRDESDIPIVLSAMNAKVHYLVSEDKDLTSQDETTAELRKQLDVLLSGTFLRQVLGWTSEELEAIRRRKWADLEIQ
jgi:predicted nucleic acid-binding protein